MAVRRFTASWSTVAGVRRAAYSAVPVLIVAALAVLALTVRSEALPGRLTAATPEPDATLEQQCTAGAAVGVGNDGLASDCALLLEARDTLRGTATLDWSAATAIADWTGITTGGTPQRVTGLSLTYQRLSGTIPAQLAGLDKLEDLQLSHNALTGPIPAELGSLSELDVLYLRSNQLTGAIPPELGNLAKLRFLGLNNNRLTGTIPAAFATLWNLQDLGLNNNQLTGAIPPLLGDLGLRSLYVAANSGLTGCIPAALSSVRYSDLATLSLDDCAAEATHTLTVSQTGSGLIAPEAGSHSYRSGALARVLTIPGSAFRVASWGGDCADTPRTETACVLTMDANKTASVTFERAQTLTVSAGEGGSADPPAGSHRYALGASVTVTATPGDGYAVASWGDDCSGSATTCVLTMSVDRTASVTFVRLSTLTTTAGEGGSIDPAAGTHFYAPGASVTVTARWDDATHDFGGWGGDCAGTATTCVLTMEADKTVTATFTALSATRCSMTNDANCIRAVYIGAPGDYAQVADIPAAMLLRGGPGGTYRVDAGLEVTVVTAARLPGGWTRFYLEPSSFPAPVSESRLVPPVGTTYTFTVSDDAAAATTITYHLKQAKPFIRPRPDGKPHIGATVVETEFEVKDCSSGIAVTNPDTNTELVADCAALLGLRDTIRGTARLNWTAGKAMSDWMGVTVSGTPQRVTSLNLADLSLDGELSGLLGNLTGLTELRLNGNALTGMLPSKLALLTSLTSVSLSGTSFEGCAPASMNAAGATGLADCGDPVVLEPRDTVMQSGTYRFLGPGADAMGEKPLVFDVPPGLSLHWVGLTLSARTDGCGRPCSHTMVVLEDTVTGGRVGIDLLYGDEGVGGTATDWIEDDAARQRVDRLFDMLRESVWFVEE